MANFQRQGHEALRFVGGITKHHALIACSLGLRACFLHALVDIRGLLMDGRDYPARIRIEHVFGFGVAYFANGIAGNQLGIYVAFGFDLARKYCQTGGDQGLTSHLGIGILCQEGVQERIGNLVSNLVRMPFGD